MENVDRKSVSPKTTKLELLQKIWSRIKPEEKEDKIVSIYMRMVNNSVSASACIMLLLDENNNELYFKLGNGQGAQKYKRLHIGRKSDIAEWIIQNGKPVVVGNEEKNARFYRRMEDATGFKTKAVIGVPIIIDGKVKGVIEALNKKDGGYFTNDDLHSMINIAETAGITIKNTRLSATLLHSYQCTVKALVSLADAKETSGGGHSKRVSEYALMGANELPLTEMQKQDIEWAGFLHDIGKLSISDEVLNKAGPLNKSEWEMIRRHPLVGYNMLKDIPFLKDSALLILHHHERYDGGGYPHGIAGEEIPMGARLIAIADAFDYMTTEHMHRKALTGQQAFNELSKNINTQFCPVVMKAFNKGFIRARFVK